ncbi:MAG: hypothetical protein HOP08_05310 [Cyclobacteriaceae bacterium]|nr:hypothetical protein [Cyclobacteriaceae bacterium]
MKVKFFAILIFVTAVIPIWAQQVVSEPVKEPAREPAKEIEELRLKLNSDGSHFIKATFLNQVWFRFNDSNPGTQVLGQNESQTFDIGLRRTRLQLYGQLTDHVSFYFQFGQNNFNYLTQNAGNRKLEVFFHDALAEYRFSPKNDKLILGGGLTITNGLSRFSQPSIGTIMSMDVPVFGQATVDQTDEFSRKLSIYARGQLGKLDYRLVISDPFPVTTNGTTLPAIGSNAQFSQIGHNKQYQGFFMWNFFDKESHVTPYMTGTYLGKKKVLNLEAGFITQKDAMWVAGPDPINPTVNPGFQDMNLWSVAMFYDAPVNKEKGTAINAYLGYFGTNYGTGYLRYNNAMNPGSALAGGAPYPASSQGNAFPMFGTGNQIYGQFGYLMKKDLFGEGNGTLMPYVTVQSANFDRIPEAMNVYSAGINWFIKGHTSKITLDYQNRPTYNADFTSGDRKGQVVLQYQIFF